MKRKATPRPTQVTRKCRYCKGEGRILHRALSEPSYYQEGWRENCPDCHGTGIVTVWGMESR